ncbi:hypothetical protein HMPREF1991_03233 [Hoylesella loescheii DSM 19665 = JCM 12249 = ATCC 15930]|uniref:Uncharacterized protein n=1 Tax=Hoylesella loescheii DSM 19665 = JCM 12249 = ATCC 15930 TaxID=1122985 RepID=A0A069QD68_HOYLO|nr:hypothetical protein HMPREF1991_03233 [Hoylesella loescheii DSM 19665 = JCM 12249 = ATCC 15930]
MDGLAKFFYLWRFDRNEKKYHPFIKKTPITLCRLFYFHYSCTHGTTYPITLNY